MLHVDCCLVCGARDLETAARYAYERPPRRSYEELSDYFERRRWILFEAMLPGESRATFEVSHCDRCDLLFLNPRFTKEEIAAKYAVLNKLNSTRQEYVRNPVRHFEARARRIAELIAPYRRDAGDRILDYGGQFGHNLRYLSGRKFIVDYEPHIMYSDIEYAGPDLSAIPAESCQVILANHIVEHLSAPLETMQQIASRLVPGGVLYVEVPCGAFREAFHVREPITHFNFFSEQSLVNLCGEVALNPVHLSTDYQWVTTGKEWCINLVCVKDAGKQPMRRPLTVAQLRNRLPFYPPMVLERARAKLVNLLESRV
jgi:SAM-dependent methyltransferase